ncbi:MAG: zinc carboxypeptidase [Candidatus Coatesbacteria bacterium]|nr:zinc carboxypeptidase [Candidatus Coatesbacteria bacterium]
MIGIKKATGLALLMACLCLLAAGGKAEVKALVAVPPDAVQEALTLGAGTIEMGESRFDSWPTLIVTGRGLSRLAESGLDHLVIDGDFTRNLRALDSDMGDYSTFEEMTTELERLEAEYSGLLSLRSIGQSIEGRDILMAVVSGAQGEDAVGGTCLLVGLHHAREIITSEVVLHVLRYLLESYGSDPEMTYLLDHRQVFLVPMLNPDGHLRVEEGHDWRKNTRDNGDGTFGVDLNRNYSYQWGYDDVGSSPETSSETYRGPEAFSEPETQAIRDLRLNTPYDVSLSFHSFGNIIFYPWSYSDLFSPDHALQSRLASIISAEGGYNYGNTAHLEYYPANGEFDDWNYAGLGYEQAVFGMTVEVGDTYYEDEDSVEELCEENLNSCIQAIRASGSWLNIDQFRIVESEADGVLREGETFCLELDVQSLSPFELRKITISCSTASPLLSITKPVIRIEYLDPLAKLVSSDCSFDLIALYGEELPQIVSFTVDVETTGFQRQIELKVPVGATRDEEVISWDFEDDDDFDTFGFWQSGAPSGGGGLYNGNPGPTLAYSGEKVYGTLLHGDVSGPDGRFILTSPEFSCEGFSCTRLFFQRWMNIGDWDDYRASVCVFAGGRWHGVWQSFNETTDSEWTEQSLDISRWADGRDKVRVRISLQANSRERYSGLYLDDMRVSGSSLLPRSYSDRVVVPLLLYMPDGALDTVVVVQNRRESMRQVQFEFRNQDGSVRESSDVIAPRGFSTISASAEAGEGFSCANIRMDDVDDLNISAFMVDLNSSALYPIDIIPEDTIEVDLHVYSVDGYGGTDSFLLISNNSTDRDVLSLNISASGAHGSVIGSFADSLSGDEIRLLPLGGYLGPGLGTVKVTSDKLGLAVCGIMTLSNGRELQLMRTFCRN